MLADPNIKSAAAISTPYGQFNYAREVCDACEAEAFGYTITVSGDREVLVSDFLYPTWFDPAKDISTDGFDKEGHVKSPFQCLPGCHMDVYDVNRGAWRTFWGEGQPYRYEPQPVPGTRRAHRRRPPSHWRNSTLVVRGAIE
jgi:hypothetical protein